ncbi:MAG: cation:proton antiporter [Gammaproteobacteria bacterium]|nr:cation:proton antiporter [Gammaproteobacteria bacterium]
MSELAFSSLAVLFLAFGLLSRRIEGSLVTGPMLFAGFGILVGPAVLGVVALNLDNDAIHLLAEITLVLVLFSDAASIDLRQLGNDHNLPARMLLVGMPLTIVLGTLAAMMMFTALGPWEAALLAAILAPTDAALGQAVVSNRAVPVRIRQALNVEGGLNDGIALPVVLLFAAFASATQEPGDARYWLEFAAKQVVLGPLSGVVIGFAGAKLVGLAYRRGWMTESAEGMVALALAFGCFTAAESVHGNGFLAAFTGGMLFGNTLRQKCQYLYEFADSEGQILVLLTFFVFGAVMFPLALPDMSPTNVVFGVLVLTVLRIIPVIIALLGTGLSATSWLFLGWFGPRGLASVLFVLLVLDESNLVHEKTVFAAAIATVLLSIALHGMSAGVGARAYARRAREMGECEENMPVADEPFVPPVRRAGGVAE